MHTPVFCRKIVIEGRTTYYAYTRVAATGGAYLTSDVTGLRALAEALGWLVAPRVGTRLYVSREAFLALVARSERAGGPGANSPLNTASPEIESPNRRQRTPRNTRTGEP